MPNPLQHVTRRNWVIASVRLYDLKLLQDCCPSVRWRGDPQSPSIAEPFTMRNSSRQFLLRFRIHIILVLMMIAAGWIGWHAYWIHQRHVFLASHPGALGGKHRDTVHAPLSLRLLGEKDVLSLQMNVYSERNWGK